MKKIISMLLTVLLLVSFFSVSAFAAESGGESTSILGYDENVAGNGISADDVTANNENVVLNESISINSTSENNFSTQAITDAPIPDGVYKIKNLYNGLYVSVYSPGYNSGTSVVQCIDVSTISGMEDLEVNQLFKVKYLGTYGASELDYYSIRPMTNSGLGLYASYSTVGNVSVRTMQTTDSWSIPYTQCWAITANGSYFTIRNGSDSYNSYLSTPASSINDAPIITSTSITNRSKWSFEAYTGEDIDTIRMSNFSSSLKCGESFDYDAYMRSSQVGVNGPVTYRVGNTDYSTTDKATINSATGELTALKSGTIKVGVTYSSAPWVWWWTVEIEPCFVNGLIDKGYVAHSDIESTDDGFYMLTKSLADVLNSANITTLKENSSGTVSRNVRDYYDDWYIYAVESSGGYSYGMLKMREPENDGKDGDDTGVTVSFVNLNYSKLLTLLNSNTTTNSYSFLQNLEAVTGPGSVDYDDTISNYFAQVESKAAYLIAEQFIEFIVDKTCVNGVIYAPANYVALFTEIAEIDELLDNIWLDSNTRLMLINQKFDLERIPNAVAANNSAAGYSVYNTNNNTINIANTNNLTIYEKYAILATHTGNVTFNSFAAEVQFHADALYDWKANFSDYYEAALRADMAVGEEYESGLFDEYYDLDSDIVQAQISEHGEY